MAVNNAPAVSSQILEIDYLAALQIGGFSWIRPTCCFFPTNWRTIPEVLFNFCCNRAYSFCPEDHPLVQIFRPSLLSLMGIQKKIRQSSAELPPSTLHCLEQVQSLLDGQLKVMQACILQELAAAEAVLESESESESESGIES